MTNLPDAHDDLLQPVPGFLVVGLGASAGGVEALRDFFAAVPADSGMAYVVILHLSPEHDSQLAMVLQTVTPLPVTQVTQRVRVVPNHVYVVPPNQHLTMVDGEVTVSPNTLVEERRAPIDIFFRTLAETHFSRAVCVVLSGTGADGSMGLKRVKERGGAVFVQNPREATFNEMPRNAIATDLVDDVLPAAAIPARIVAYRSRLGTIAIPVEAEERPEEQQQALREVLSQLRVRTGHDFSNYKRPTLLRRIERRITVRELPDLPAYAALLRDSSDEVHALLKDLLISVTNFFRDKEAFAALELEVLPRIFQGKRAGDEVRVWVVGCASGEEAYSIAMLCAERVLDTLDAPNIQIFATDIDEAAIARAREGLYSATDVADVSPERLRRFFTLEEGHYRIRREIREMILFATHNVLRDPPFSHLDLVSCRNLLIYLDRTAQERVIETLHFALSPNGYLFLGTAESVDGANDLYATINREQHIYQSRRTAARPFPVPEAVPMPRVEQSHVALSTAEPGERARERISYGDLHHRLLEQYAPPSVVLNQDYEIVHLSEQAGRYLQLRGGTLASNFLDLIRAELRAELRNALYQAVQQQTNVDAPNLPITVDGRRETVTVHVRPVLRDDDEARGFIVVLFEQGAERPSDATVVVRSEEAVTRQLEAEVERLRIQLRTSSEKYEIQAEELKASNEELQALNEELRSSKEELETSKEELQSINEELRTVNQELKVKVEEATQHSTNLQNLVNSTDIGTIFLDRGLHVKLFTPAARALFNLIPSDYGRPLADITHRLVDVNVLKDAETVLDKLQTIEHEVRTTTDQVFMLRVLPYRATEDRIGGVVITFFDITERYHAEAALRENELRFKGEKEAFQAAIGGAPLEASLDILLRTVVERRGTGVRAAFYLLDRDGTRLHPVFGAGGMPAAYLRQIHNFPVGPDSLACGLAVASSVPVITRDVFEDPLWSSWLHLAREFDLRSCWSFPIQTQGGTSVGTLAIYHREPREPTAHDLSLASAITQAAGIIISRHTEAEERARAETALRESEAKYRMLFNSIDEGFHSIELIYDEAGTAIDYRFLEANPAFEWQTGLRNAVGKLGSEIAPHTEGRWLEAYDRVVQTGEPLRFEEYNAFTERWYTTFASRVGEPDMRQVAVVFSDITERKRHEANLAFLVEVSEDLVQLTNIDETMNRIGAKIGRFFGVKHCLFTEHANTFETSISAYGWNAEDAPNLKGAYRTRDFLANELIAVLMAGEPIIVSETQSDVRVSAESYGALDIRSFIIVPLVREQEWRFQIAIMDNKPREWRDDEIELIRELTTRIWTRLERARAEEALRESEERFRLLVEGARDYAMFLLDPENCITFWSTGAERLFGYAEAEAIGQSGGIIFTPEDREHGAVERELQTARAHGRAEDRRWHVRKDGTRLFVDGVLVRLDSDTGQLRAFVKIGRDATEQREAEEALQQAHALLESRVQERTSELAAANDLLQQEIVERRQLAEQRAVLLERVLTEQETERQRIARELHDTLGQFLSALNLRLSMAQSLEGMSSEGSKELIQLQALSSQIEREVDRLTMELRPLALEDFGLVHALRSYTEEWSATSGVPAEVLITGLDDTRLHPAIETTIYRIVQEALTNVTKHAQASAVSVVVKRQPGLLRVIIEDNGVGFEASEGPAPGAGGRQVGLLGMMERATLIGGELTFESAPGSGTAIYLQVPIDQDTTEG